MECDHESIMSDEDIHIESGLVLKSFCDAIRGKQTEAVVTALGTLLANMLSKCPHSVENLKNFNAFVLNTLRKTNPDVFKEANEAGAFVAQKMTEESRVMVEELNAVLNKYPELTYFAPLVVFITNIAYRTENPAQFLDNFFVGCRSFLDYVRSVAEE